MLFWPQERNEMRYIMPLVVFLAFRCVVFKAPSIVSLIIINPWTFSSGNVNSYSGNEYFCILLLLSHIFKYLIRAAAVLAGSCFCSCHAICSLCGVAVNVALNIQALEFIEGSNT